MTNDMDDEPVESGRGVESPVAPPQIDPFVAPCVLSPNLHPEQVATKCGHRIHPSASPHTPYCPECVLQSAQALLESTREQFLDQGAIGRSWRSRDRPWVLARSAYQYAFRGFENVRKRDQRRWESEQAWDEAHLRLRLEQIGNEEKLDISRTCNTCLAMKTSAPGMPPPIIDAGVAWWDRPGALAPPLEQKTPMRSHHRRRKQKTEGSPEMRRAIYIHRIRHLFTTSEQEFRENRNRIETVVRRKHLIKPESRFNPTFWDKPIPALKLRGRHQLALESKSREERQTRGNVPRPRPPQSRLSHCESTDELVNDDKLKEEIRLRELVDEVEKIERKSKKVCEEVGYLYFVGGIDREKWEEDLFKSNQRLIWRHGYQSMQGVEWIG